MITLKQLTEKVIPDLRKRFEKMLSKIYAVAHGAFSDDLWVVQKRNTMFFGESADYPAQNIKDRDAFVREWTKSVENLEKVTEFFVRKTTNDQTKHYARKITLSDFNRRCPEVLAALKETELFTRKYFQTPHGQSLAHELREAVQKDMHIIEVNLKIYNGDLQTYGNNDFDFAYHYIDVLPLKYREMEKVVEEAGKLISGLRF